LSYDAASEILDVDFGDFDEFARPKGGRAKGLRDCEVAHAERVGEVRQGVLKPPSIK
jgi:hypothetical protein